MTVVTEIFPLNSILIRRSFVARLGFKLKELGLQLIENIALLSVFVF